MRLPFRRKSKLPSVLPAHLAVIMDGNGRWASRRGLPRSAGHKAGFDNFVKTVEFCAAAGIGYLTVYAFSTENWNRSDDEVGALMRIMKDAIVEYVPTLRERNIRLRILGDLSRFEPDARAGLEDSVAALAGNTGMTLSVALSYGGRDEIVAAARKAAAAGEITEGDAFGAPLHRRHARPRPHHPHQRRAARVQFPALAERVQRILFHPDPLARFRARGAMPRPVGLQRPQAPLRPCVRDLHL